MNVLGSGGSNQVVATLVHGKKHLSYVEFKPVWDKDIPDLDNTLNFLTVLSFGVQSDLNWAAPLAVVTAIFRACFLGEAIQLPLGGNNPAGVLGQISGMLELAEQIERGDCPDPDAVYVAVGSSCTVSGLILGVALARHLKMRAFLKPNFSINAMPIHEYSAWAERDFKLHSSWVGGFMPLTIRHTVQSTCAALRRLGGPDLLALALQVMRENLRLDCDADIVGIYGGHSDISRTAAAAYDSSGEVQAQGDGAQSVPPLWLCGHFAAKPFTVMLADLEAKPDHVALFWQTKSAVQPRSGAANEFERLQGMPGAVQDWANEGRAESTLRKGSVSTNGSSADYRHLMTLLDEE